MSFKIYTKKGDEGKTYLASGDEVAKDDLRIQAYGSLDELNANLAFVLSLMDEKLAEDRNIILKVQHKLFNLGSLISFAKVELISRDEVLLLEHRIDVLSEIIPVLKNFILPGGSKLNASLHIARTVCRRAERDIIGAKSNINSEALQFINRLSDYLFILARYVLHLENKQEIRWNQI